MAELTPLGPDELRGKVVAVNFCTYTCINWPRSLPYVRAWDELYRDDGLVTIGVHTPEFTFEHDVHNVRSALDEMRVTYPIAIDNDYAVWEAFSNHYWPALYLIDADGRIRHHQFGEGEYERTEMVLQRMLADANGGEPAHGIVTVDPRPPEIAADWSHLRSAETYLGYGRGRGFASPGGIAPNEARTYAQPYSELNEWALAGDWTIGPEAAMLDGSFGRIALRFHARDVHLVVSPATPEAPTRFNVLVDSAAPGASAGSDVDTKGAGKLVEPRMYQSIRHRPPIEDRLLEIEFPDGGAKAFAFTFG